MSSSNSKRRCDPKIIERLSSGLILEKLLNMASGPSMTDETPPKAAEFAPAKEISALWASISEVRKLKKIDAKRSLFIFIVKEVLQVDQKITLFKIFKRNLT